MPWYAIVWIIGSVIIFLSPMLMGDKDFAGPKAEEGLTTLFLVAAFWPIILAFAAVILPIYGFCVGLLYLYQRGTQMTMKMWERREAFKKSQV